MYSNYCLKDPRFSSKNQKVGLITRKKGFVAKWKFLHFLITKYSNMATFSACSQVTCSPRGVVTPVLHDRNNSGNKGGNNMQQIESSVAMVTKPIQWEEFAAYDKLFSYFV